MTSSRFPCTVLPFFVLGDGQERLWMLPPPCIYMRERESRDCSIPCIPYFSRRNHSILFRSIPDFSNHRKGWRHSCTSLSWNPPRLSLWVFSKAERKKSGTESLSTRLCSYVQTIACDMYTLLSWCVGGCCYKCTWTPKFFWEWACVRKQLTPGRFLSSHAALEWGPTRTLLFYYPYNLSFCFSYE